MPVAPISKATIGVSSPHYPGGAARFGDPPEGPEIKRRPIRDVRMLPTHPIRCRDCETRKQMLKGWGERRGACNALAIMSSGLDSVGHKTCESESGMFPGQGARAQRSRACTLGSCFCMIVSRAAFGAVRNGAHRD